MVSLDYLICERVSWLIAFDLDLGRLHCHDEGWKTRDCQATVDRQRARVGVECEVKVKVTVSRPVARS